MDRFAKEYLKILKTDKNRNKMILILVLVLLILSMPVLFLLLGGPEKIASLSKRDKNPIDIDGEAVVSKVNQGITEVVGTTAEPEVEQQDTTVEDIVRISELQTLEYSYDAICPVYDNGEVVYYIAYESTVSLGINTSDIQFIYLRGDENVVTVILPPVEVLGINVDAGSMDYIFMNRDYDNYYASTSAQLFCEEDVNGKINQDETLFASARDNTEAEIRALTEPLIEQIYPDYDLVIIWGN